MSRDTVDSVLNSIKSLKIDETVSNSYIDVSESIRETGAPSNNTLLTIILSEIRRGNDETMKLTNSINKLNSSITDMTDKLMESIDNQTEIMASMRVNDMTSETTHLKGKAGSVENSWYYKSIRLSSKHHVLACFILQLMSIVQTHIDHMNIQYPDSVDCDFNVMVTMIRVVCSKPCRAKSVEYKPPIILKTMSDQAFDTIYPYISSKDQKNVTTLIEDTLSKMINPVTRDVMQGIEYVRQRLCLMECVLSARQIDILKSIKFPFNKDNKLNWDPSIVRARPVHPSTQEISTLASKQKEAYALSRLDGKNIIESHEIARNTKK